MLENSLKELKRVFAQQASLVEKMIKLAVQSLLVANSEQANEVIEALEPKCNGNEIEIDSIATEILARYAPRAGNMRKVVSIIKANTDLERMGDLASNIAKSSLYLMKHPPLRALKDLPEMADMTISMIHRAMDAFLMENVSLAWKVFSDDARVDELQDNIMNELVELIEQNPAVTARALRLLFIAGSLERIGDLSLNLCEDVVYSVTGEDVKHPSNVEL